MSSRYSANQYEDAFKPQKMQNWCVGKNVERVKRPAARKDRTTFIVDDRMHLLPGLAKGSAWPDPTARVPFSIINPTARSVAGLTRLKAQGLDLDTQCTSTYQPRGGSKDTARLQNGNEQVVEDLQQDESASSTHTPAALALEASQSRPLSGAERPASSALADEKDKPSSPRMKTQHSLDRKPARSQESEQPA